MKDPARQAGCALTDRHDVMPVLPADLPVYTQSGFAVTGFLTRNLNATLAGATYGRVNVGVQDALDDLAGGRRLRPRERARDGTRQHERRREHRRGPPPPPPATMVWGSRPRGEVPT